MAWASVEAAARAAVAAEAAPLASLEDWRALRAAQEQFAREMIAHAAEGLPAEARQVLGVLRAAVLSLEYTAKPMHVLELLTILAGDCPAQTDRFVADLDLRLQSTAALAALRQRIALETDGKPN